MKARTTAAGLVCPADTAHGPLLEIDGALRCVSQEHDGRPKTHPLGAAAATRSRFSLNEVLTPTAAAPLAPSAAAGTTARVSIDPPGVLYARGSGGRTNAETRSRNHQQEGLGL